MRIPAFIRLTLIPLAVLSLFIFPWPLTIAFMFCAGLVFPPAPLFIGVFADFVYYPGFGTGVWPHATLIGFGLSVITYSVQHFVKTRIM